MISADNLSAGIASAAFVAYLSGLTNVAYSATQYALFSSIMLLLPKFMAGWSGLAVDSYGYQTFFIGTALLGLPVVILTWLVWQQSKRPRRRVRRRLGLKLDRPQCPAALRVPRDLGYQRRRHRDGTPRARRADWAAAAWLPSGHHHALENAHAVDRRRTPRNRGW